MNQILLHTNLVILSTFVTTNPVYRQIGHSYPAQPLIVWAGERRQTNYILGYSDGTNRLVVCTNTIGLGGSR